MMLSNGMRVRIIKDGILHGQEGSINGIDGETVVVMLDDGTTVGVTPGDVQPLPQQPDPTAQLVQVKLPEGAMIHVNGIPAETVLGVVRLHPQARFQLQQQFNEPLPEVQIGGHQVDSATGQATPFGVPLPGAGGAGPFVSGGMPHPSFPGAAIPHTAVNEDFVRLSLARQLLDLFLHMRHHMIEAAGVPDEDDVDPGEEWKQHRLAENAPVFQFSETESHLYDSACNVLADFLNKGRSPGH
jgi:hypothetical protein